MNLKTTILLIVVIASTTLFTTANAQSVLMSSVGMLSGTSSNVTAVNFKSTATCIDVQSGIAVFNGTRGFGEFAVNCAITQEFNTLGIKLFPNPARTNTKAQFINTPPLTETFSVSVWNTEGAMMSTRKETGYSILQGIMLDVSNLVSGSYVLRVESTKFVEAIKFIKAN